MGGRKIVLTLAIPALLGFGVASAVADDSDYPPPAVCVSAVGPVDAGGHGDTTPAVAGDCP